MKVVGRVLLFLPITGVRLMAGPAGVPALGGTGGAALPTNEPANELLPGNVLTFLCD